MTDTIREQIIQGFVTRAAVIRTTAYNTNIGQAALRSRPRVAALPCCVIWAQTEAAENKMGKVLHRMPVRVEGFAAHGSEAAAIVAEKILGDLIKCFTSPAWVRPLIENIVYQRGGANESPEDGATSKGASAEFLVSYYTAIGNPYAQ
jgi:hypothetical protein